MHQQHYIKECEDRVIDKITAAWDCSFPLFREMNKNLRDESDMCFQVCAVGRKVLNLAKGYYLGIKPASHF